MTSQATLETEEANCAPDGCPFYEGEDLFGSITNADILVLLSGALAAVANPIASPGQAVSVPAVLLNPTSVQSYVADTTTIEFELLQYNFGNTGFITSLIQAGHDGYFAASPPPNVTQNVLALLGSGGWFNFMQAAGIVSSSCIAMQDSFAIALREPSGACQQK